jgi:hypothetical protein
VLVGVNEYAAHRGCSPAAIEYAISKGYVHRDENGLIDAEKADAHWATVANPAQAKRVQAGESTKGAWTETRAAAVAASKFAEAQTIAKNINFAESRAVKEAWAAKLKELEYECKKASLISREEVEIAAETAGRKFRDALFNLPPRLASQLAAETDSFEIQRTLEAELRLVLDEAFGPGRLT